MSPEELKFKIHEFEKLEGFGGERGGCVKQFAKAFCFSDVVE